MKNSVTVYSLFLKIKKSEYILIFLPVILGREKS